VRKSRAINSPLYRAAIGDEFSLQPFGFSTKRSDFASGLVYFGYRFYVPHLGRWLNRDPLQEEGGINLYAYVKGDPLGYVDPDGLARFGFRRMHPTYPSFFPCGNYNHHPVHEQLWFDDNPSDNAGFFPGDRNEAGPKYCGEAGDVRSDNGYSRGDCHFLDEIYNLTLMGQKKSSLSFQTTNSD
jgi:RHS repeat-associated protein